MWGNSTGGFDKDALQMTRKGRGHDLHRWKQNLLQPSGVPMPDTSIERLVMTNDDANYPNPKLTVFNYSSTLQTFGVAQEIKAFGSRAVTSAFLNDDLLVDLAAPWYTKPLVQWFEQDSDRSFIPHDDLDENTLVGGGPHAVSAGLVSKTDTNPPQIDARVDLVVAFEAEDRLAVLINAGVSGPLFASQQIFVTLTEIPSEVLFPRQVVVVDLNGDGVQDIIATNRGVLGDDDAEGITVLINRPD